jgi:hypothetical protein
LPIVVYLGYSIHGNESSGTGAAIALATTSLLQKVQSWKNTRKTIILLDPSFNPDGLHFFHMGKQ